jgi:hypothetical protein
MERPFIVLLQWQLMLHLAGFHFDPYYACLVPLIFIFIIIFFVFLVCILFLIFFNADVFSYEFGLNISLTWKGNLFFVSFDIALFLLIVFQRVGVECISAIVPEKVFELIS